MNLNFLTVQKIQRGAVVIHCCTSPDNGERVNAQIIETPNRLVVVDAMLLRAHAKELRAYADSLGKPIDRIFITHAHPDHWFGIEFFQDVPSYALAETMGELQFMAPIAIGFHRSNHGDGVIDKAIFPTNTIAEGPFEIDGIGFRAMKITSAEDLFLLALDIPSIQTLLAQDLVYNKVHLFVGQLDQNGGTCFDGWTAALETFKQTNYALVLPGHGVPTDASVFAENIAYLNRMRELVATSTGQNFVERAMATFPDYELRSMLDMSAYFLFKPPQ